MLKMIKTLVVVFSISGIVYSQDASYYFDGSSYIDLGIVGTDFTNVDFTISAWIRSCQNEEGMGILTKSDGDLNWEDQEKSFYVDESGYPTFVGHGNEFIRGNVQVNDGSWHHVAVTWDYSELAGNIYVDAVNSTSGSTNYAPNNADNNAHNLFIGLANYQFDEAPNSFHGNIDEIRLWGEIRDQQAIEDDMNGQVLDGLEETLIGYWDFDGNGGGNLLGGIGPGGNSGSIINALGNGYWSTDVFEYNTRCFDYELTEADFPFNHLSDLTCSSDLWDQNYFPYQEAGEGHSNNANGNDFTYKLTLSEPAKIYITTCDDQTNVDVQIAVYTDCDTTGSWIFFQDDSDKPIYYPDGTQDQYTFSCISGFEANPTWANMLPLLEWEAGTYYIVVDDRNGANGSVRTWIGSSLLVDSTMVSGDYLEVDYYFSEGVYGGNYSDVYYGNGIGLETSDFSLQIDANGGNADEASLLSVVSENNGALSGGEATVVLNLDYPITPSGGEILTVGPASVSSIFNSVGVPLLDTLGISFNLVDEVLPTIVSTEPVNGAIDIATGANILVTFSEPVQNSVDGNNITDANATDCFLLEEADSGSDLNFMITSLDQIEFEIIPDGQLPEDSNIRLSILSTIEDENNNGFQFQTLQFQTADESAPQIESSAISSTNSYVILTFNEGVYSTDSGSGALTIDDIEYTFSRNAGNCDSAWVTSLTNENGSDLVGGETKVHAMLELIGSPSGYETLVLRPSSNLSIFDASGNAMDTSNESAPVTLLASAYITSHVLANNNLYIDLIFSVDVFGNSIQTLPLNVNSMTASIFPGNGGNATTVDLTDITDTEGNPITEGTNAFRLSLAYDDSASGQEKIIIAPTSNWSIFSLSGIPVPISEATDSILLFDRLPPDGESSIEDEATDINKEDSISITFNENIFIPDTDPPVPADTSYLRNYITLENDSGIPILFSLDYDIDSNTLIIIPREQYESEQQVHFSFIGILVDESGNETQFNYQASFSIIDYLAPIITLVTLHDDNSYVDLFFNEGIFGDYIDGESSGTFEVSDINLTLVSNGSQVDTCTITSLTRENGEFLVGGEQNIRVNLEYNHTPDGNEEIMLERSNDATLFDGSGNQFLETGYTETLSLHDWLPPTVIDLSDPVGSIIPLMQTKIMKFYFNESITYFEIDVSSIITGPINFNAVYSDLDSSITVTIETPFASFDEINVDFVKIVDEAERENVDIAYTYNTQMLGDFDNDSKISYNDLYILKDNWLAGNDEFDLGSDNNSGTVPNIIPDPDNIFNLNDGMVFVQMWSWYQKTYGEIIEDSSQIGQLLDITQNGKDLFIILADTIISGQLQLVYEPGALPFEFSQRPSSDSEMYISSHFPQKGFSILEFARVGDFTRDAIQITMDKHTKINLFYSFDSNNKSLAQKGSVKINHNPLPVDFALYPAYPNPFNPVTTLRFDLPITEISQTLSLVIYDINGRKVESLVQGFRLPGSYEVEWHAKQFASGMYFAKLVYGTKIKTQKILLLK